MGESNKMICENNRSLEKRNQGYPSSHSAYSIQNNVERHHEEGSREYLRMNRDQRFRNVDHKPMVTGAPSFAVRKESCINNHQQYFEPPPTFHRKGPMMATQLLEGSEPRMNYYHGAHKYGDNKRCHVRTEVQHVSTKEVHVKSNESSSNPSPPGSEYYYSSNVGDRRVLDHGRKIEGNGRADQLRQKYVGASDITNGIIATEQNFSSLNMEHRNTSIDEKLRSPYLNRTFSASNNPFHSKRHGKIDETESGAIIISASSGSTDIEEDDPRFQRSSVYSGGYHGHDSGQKEQSYPPHFYGHSHEFYENNVPRENSEYPGKEFFHNSQIRKSKDLSSRQILRSYSGSDSFHRRIQRSSQDTYSQIRNVEVPPSSHPLSYRHEEGRHHRSISNPDFIGNHVPRYFHKSPPTTAMQGYSRHHHDDHYCHLYPSIDQTMSHEDDHRSMIRSNHRQISYDQDGDYVFNNETRQLGEIDEHAVGRYNDRVVYTMRKQSEQFDDEKTSHLLYLGERDLEEEGTNRNACGDSKKLKQMKRRRNSSPAAAVSQRKRKKMYSDYVGVTYNKTHAKFQACITHYRKQHYLGRFKFAVDAARAYDESARRLKGKGWKINFPTDEDYLLAKQKETDQLSVQAQDNLKTQCFEKEKEIEVLKQSEEDLEKKSTCDCEKSNEEEHELSGAKDKVDGDGTSSEVLSNNDEKNCDYVGIETLVKPFATTPTRGCRKPEDRTEENISEEKKSEIVTPTSENPSSVDDTINGTDVDAKDSVKESKASPTSVLMQEAASALMTLMSV